MRKRTAGVLAALMAGAMMLFAGAAFGYTLYWTPVTTYEDGTPIGAEAGGVFYNIIMDNVVVASRISATSWVLPAVGKKTSHTFEAQTVLGTGEVSDWSPPFAWTSPAGTPAKPSGLIVR